MSVAVSSRRTEFKSRYDERETCDECWGRLQFGGQVVYCRLCGLVHSQRRLWEESIEIEASRRQFNHASETGSGTLQDEHAVVVEDSAAATTFDGWKLPYNVYPLVEYNAGRDGHRGREDDCQKVNRERRFKEHRAQSCASSVGFTGRQLREVSRLVAEYNSGAFTEFGPEREGGGQDAHIVGAIGHVGNRYVTRFSERMENRAELVELAVSLGMDASDVRGAINRMQRIVKESRR